MDQRKPEHLRASTSSLPIVALAMLFALASFFVATSRAHSANGNGAAVGQKDFPDIEFDVPVKGNAAVNALGGKLPDLARYYGMSTSEFARLLRTDSTLWLDVKGRLYYVEPQREEIEGDASDTLAAGAYPLEDTFKLHSRPGAKRVIYLDFDGHVTSGGAWNGGATVNSPPYDRDSNPAFSNQEKYNIQEMWRQVAEDFAPFDVDITTEDPGQAAIDRTSSGDEFYGARVVITPDKTGLCGSCGGIAYVGVFDMVGNNYYSPAYVFNQGIVGAGEAISHEVGHNLGLWHDNFDGLDNYYQGHGTGATGWAPIMGVGYNKNLVQWSQGEYNRASQFQDDLAVISANGTTPLALPDDHGDSYQTSTLLEQTPDTVSTALYGQGNIERRTDVDVFAFVAGDGDYSINVDPVPVSPNLDIEITLLDSAGNTVVSANPLEALPASLSGSLSAGEYFLVVDGAGKGDVLGTGYSDYGSLGRYTVSGTVADASGLQPPVAVVTAPSYAAGIAPLLVFLDGSGSADPDGTIDAYRWSLGDGTPEFGGPGTPDYTHQYTAPGTFTVSLTVTDNDGLTANDSVEITVINQPPLAVASAGAPSGPAPSASVDFIGSGSSNPDPIDALAASSLTFSWDFGDGGSSTEADPTHVYTTSGTFEATLTVTDDFGDSTSDSVTVVIDAPAFVEQSAIGQILVAGSVSGGIGATAAADGSFQTVTERESGGKKNSRYSYLEHIWQFDVSGGDTVTLSVTGYRSGIEGEAMVFAYAVAPDLGNYTPITGIVLGTNTSTQTAVLPTGTQGEVRIRVQDEVQEGSSRSLDSAAIDQVVIRSENGNGGGPVDPPPPPPEDPLPNPVTSLVATEITETFVALDWQPGSSDNAPAAQSYTIERSANGGSSWSGLDSGFTASAYTDSAVSVGAVYSYRVRASANSFDSDWTVLNNVEIPSPPGSLTLQASGSKTKGTKLVTLVWGGATEVDVYLSGVFVEKTSDNPYTKTHGKGGGTYAYKVCEVNNPDNCSPVATVVF